MRAEHPQTLFHGVEVDAAMIPLLRELWHRGIRTVASCQGWSVMDGAAYVAFVTEQDYATFKAIVLGVSDVVVDVQPSSEILERLGDPDFVKMVAERGGCWAVAFPADDLRAVIAATRHLC